MPSVHVAVAPASEHILRVARECYCPHATIHLQISHPPPCPPIHQNDVPIVPYKGDRPSIGRDSELLQAPLTPSDYGGYALDLPRERVVHVEEGPAAGQHHTARIAQEGGARYGHLGKVNSVDLRVVPLVAVWVYSEEAQHLVHSRGHQQRLVLVGPRVELEGRYDRVVGVGEISVAGAHHVQESGGERSSRCGRCEEGCVGFQNVLGDVVPVSVMVIIAAFLGGGGGVPPLLLRLRLSTGVTFLLPSGQTDLRPVRPRRDAGRADEPLAQSPLVLPD
mmetsp:Transcript_58597/g.124363  ORF Transcript_58597/g.124363 Transcript_58597/m.124363 type:complete len:278 (+) Transcript_58597:792-1625(+)